MRPSGNPEWKHNDVISEDKLNAIEAALKAVETVSSLPAAGLVGRIVRLSSDNRLYFDDGSAWQQLSAKADLDAHAANPNAHKGQKGSIELDEGDLQLVGDEASPGANKVYGTDGSGSKGWYDAPEGKGKRVSRLTVGTSTAGWTSDDVDYLCDGTDDQVEINAAIQALPANGGEVCLLDGSYNITAPINMKSYVRLRGNGMATKLIKQWQSTFDEGVILLSGLSGCVIENIAIDGNSYTTTQDYGIRLLSENDSIWVRNVQIESNRTGILCSGSIKRSFFCNNIIINADNRGIDLRNAEDCLVSGNFFHVGSRAINLQDTTNTRVIGNVTKGGDAMGIMLLRTSNSIVIGNHCFDHFQGIEISSSDFNTIVGNVCMRGDGDSGDYSGSQGTIRIDGEHNLVSSNHVMGKAVVDNGTGNLIVNNKYQ